MAQTGYQASNLLEAMIVSAEDNNTVFTEDELFANIVVLLIAGEDTTANSLAWTIHYLIDHQTIQTEIHQEIKASPANTMDMSLEDFEKYPLAFAAGEEAIRMMPVAPFLYLENISQQNIQDYHIPEKTMIITLLSQSSFDKNLFTNPEEFNPSRWLKMTEEDQKKIKKKLMPFGGGPRICPGRLLSYLEMKTALVAMLGDYQFTRAEGSLATLDRFEFTVMPKNLMVNVTKR